MSQFPYKATIKVGNQIIRPIIYAQNVVLAKAIVAAQYSGGSLLQIVRCG
jgi:hypothetical protein